MLKDDDLLEQGVGGEGFGSEVGGDSTTKILVILTEHVDQIMFAK